MNNTNPSTAEYKQPDLFPTKDYGYKPCPVPRLAVEYAKPSERTRSKEQYKLISEEHSVRLTRIFTFSIAIEIRNRTRGFDFRLHPNGKPKCWRELRQVLIDLTGKGTAYEVEKC